MCLHILCRCCSKIICSSFLYRLDFNNIVPKRQYLYQKHGFTQIQTHTHRGPAAEWYEVLQPYLSFSSNIRRWFANTVFLQNRARFCEYLLECPSPEVGSKLVVYIEQVSMDLWEARQVFFMQTSRNSDRVCSCCLFSNVFSYLILLHDDKSFVCFRLLSGTKHVLQSHHFPVQFNEQ